MIRDLVISSCVLDSFVVSGISICQNVSCSSLVFLVKFGIPFIFPAYLGLILVLTDFIAAFLRFRAAFDTNLYQLCLFYFPDIVINFIVKPNYNVTDTATLNMIITIKSKMTVL